MLAVSNRPSPRALALCALLLAAALVSPSVQATGQAPHKPKKVKITKSPVPYESNSGESPKERERRLLRECKGRVNAGACAGYTGQ